VPSSQSTTGHRYAENEESSGKGCRNPGGKCGQNAKRLKPYLFIITGDNGKEFAHHKTIAESLGIKFYFA